MRHGGLAVICALGVAAAPLTARASDPLPAPTSDEETLAATPRLAPTSGASPRPRRGLGLLGAGVPISALGIVGLGFGGAFLYEDLPSVCADEPCGSAGRSLSFFGASIFIAGLVTFASGAAMTAVGAVRHHRYRQWRAKQTARSWAPGLTRSAHGTWLTGLELRF